MLHNERNFVKTQQLHDVNELLKKKLTIYLKVANIHGVNLLHNYNSVRKNCNEYYYIYITNNKQ